MSCVSLKDKQNYIDQLFKRNGIKTSVNDIRFDPAGRYLNKIILGDLKDEYEDVLQKNPSWYISELIAFGPKMYQLILCDKHSGQVIKWVKTMKGISVKGNVDMFQMTRSPYIEILC